MAYECQNFKPGQILTAEQMNRLDEWLEYICGRELTAVGTNANGELEFTFCNGTKLNCGVVGVTVASVEQSSEDDRYNVITFSDSSQLKVKNGSSGVYVGTGTPPSNATVWINPEGEPTSTEDWEFDLDDGSTEEKTVVVVGSDEATASGKLAILRMKDAGGNWVEIPAIVGTPGKDGEDGYTPQKGVDYFDGTNGKDGSDGKSAYQYAVDGGYTGTEAEFMAKLATEFLPLSGGTLTGGITIPNGAFFKAACSAGMRSNTSGALIINGTNNAIYLRPTNTSDTTNGVRVYNGAFMPENTEQVSLGTSALMWTDLYLSGVLSDGTNSVAVADIHHDGNATRGTLVSTETDPTTNNHINWTYE